MYAKLKKNHLEGWGIQEWMQSVTKQSNCITNVWNSFTEDDTIGADLSKFGNKWRL